MEKKLKYYIYKNNLDRTVKILNNISNPFPYFIKSDLFVLSSVFEGLPNVLLEALTLKKFVISTNCSTGPSEILLKGKGGILVPIKDYKNLANKIATLVSFEGEILWDKSKPDGTPKKQLNTKKINSLGWSPKISLDEGIKKTLELIKRKNLL